VSQQTLHGIYLLGRLRWISCSSHLDRPRSQSCMIVVLSTIAQCITRCRVISSSSFLKFFLNLFFPVLCRLQEKHMMRSNSGLLTPPSDQEGSIRTRYRSVKPNIASRFRFSRQRQKAVSLYFVCILLVFLFGSSSSPTSTLRHIFSQRADPVARTTFPKKFWQIWKVPTLHFEERDLVRARSWTHLNSGYRYEVLTDDNALQWVESHYGPSGLNRPDIVNMYQTIGLTIIKADLLTTT